MTGRIHTYTSFDWVLFRAAELLGTPLFRFISAMCRYEVMGYENFKIAAEYNKGVICALWHGRMLIPVYHMRGRGISSLVSLHRDGEIVTRIVRRLGYVIHRGSPKEAGREGFQAMLKDLKSHKTVAIFPDGPTGPAKSVRSGVVHLARLSGAPIVPMSYSAKPCWQFKSWDGFMVPKFSSRGIFVIGEPFFIPRRFDDDYGLERAKRQIQDSINAVQEQADEMMGNK